ncbi:peptidoglycan -binding protein [Arenibacterium sp. CAU 1754]
MALSRRTGQRFQASIWPGFVDAMTGLLLVLMFVLTIFMVVQFVLRETISGQESELDLLSGEIAALAQALGLEERRANQLEARMGALNTTLGETRNDLESAQSELANRAALISSLTAERAAQDAVLDQARIQITDFEAQVAALIATRDRAFADIRTLQQERSALQEEQTELLSGQEALNAALAQSRSEIDEQTEAARLAAAKRKALEALIADLRSEQAVTQARAEDLSGRVATLETQLSEEEANRLAESAAAEALRKRLEEADTELTAMTLALEKQRQEAEDTLTLLAAAEAARKDLDAKLLAALGAAETAQAQVQERDELAQRLTRVLNQMEATQAQNDQMIAALEAELSNTQTARDETTAALRAQLDEAAQTRTRLESELTAARAATQLSEQDRATVEEKLLTALQSLEQAQAAATDEEELRARLLAALAAREQAEATAADQLSLAEQRAALLAQARTTLSEQSEKSQAAQRETELLNQQVAALRGQLGQLQALLDDYEERDAAAKVQIQNLGSDLNTALARAASEERKRRLLEEAERKRLEKEAKALAAETEALKTQTKDLERYRSEFFGRLRDVLGRQEGVRIEGDRFVFSSEVLFPPGGAELSEDGRREVAKVANILRGIANDIPPEIDWVIRVDGHTDDTPLIAGAKYADNWELSQGRALSVVKYMVNALGIPPDRLAANGFGEYQPVNPADTPEARAQNRRIELKFTEK